MIYCGCEEDLQLRKNLLLAFVIAVGGVPPVSARANG
jgi:hypothetical protein